jgi:hypothetical protein
MENKNQNQNIKMQDMNFINLNFLSNNGIMI